MACLLQLDERLRVPRRKTVSTFLDNATFGIVGYRLGTIVAEASFQIGSGHGARHHEIVDFDPTPSQPSFAQLVDQYPHPAGWSRKAAISRSRRAPGRAPGHFAWSVGAGGPLLLVGGGSGVVPLIAMLRHRAARGEAGRAVPARLL